MIKSLAGMNGISVTNNLSYSPSVTGSMRWNSQSQCMEVMDGMSWQQINMEYATISLDDDTKTLIEWVRKKKMEEETLATLCELHPEIKDLTDRIEIFKRLVKENI